MSKMKIIGAFLSGVVVGSIITWNVWKYRMEHATFEEAEDDEINNPKLFEEPKEKPSSYVATSLTPTERYDEVSKRVEEILSDSGYVSKKEKKPSVYVIAPEELGEEMDYDTIEFTYYADGVLTDENDEVLENWATILPEDFADHFGEYEEDSVYVRNDRLKCDYVILRDQDPFHKTKRGRE